MPNSGVGFGVHSFDLNVHHSERISDNASIFIAEMSAIEYALMHALSLPSPLSITIISDSLSVLKFLLRSPTIEITPIHLRILQAYTSLLANGSQARLVWVPNHIGLHGNDQADLLAKIGSSLPSHHIEPLIDSSYIFNKIDQYILFIWQQRFDSSSPNHYKPIQPDVSFSPPFTNNHHRRLERIITSLRLNHLPLNHQKFLRRQHPDGLCTHCMVPETISHFLLQCPFFKILPPGHNFTLSTILSAQFNHSSFISSVIKRSRF